MTKSEIQIFIEEMESIGDIWTEEQVKNCYGNIPLRQALETRKTEVNQFLTILGTAKIYLSY